VTVGSAGKTFSVTGWKLGWSVGPEKLLYGPKLVHTNCVYTCPTPIQVNCVCVCACVCIGGECRGAWVGWSAGPEKLLYGPKLVHTNCVYNCPTPIQVGFFWLQIFIVLS
jgi:aspartate/methionine/tyrosine aminotransferase